MPPKPAEQAVLQAIDRFLRTSNWLTDVQDISFLAAGEYNANYLVSCRQENYVFRLNQGSQLNLSNQIEYEYRVLKALEPTGVTPRAFAYDPQPADLPGGVLLMQYLPGRALDYRQDLEKAAAILARIHGQEVDQQGFVRQEDPVADIVRECEQLIHRYPQHPMRKERDQIVQYMHQVMHLGEQTRDLMLQERMCLVNTEVNSGNFLISEQGAYLVDWEKAVISQRYQDLGHFLVPTTTLWKSPHVLSEAEKNDFLAVYRDQAGLNESLEEIRHKTKILEKTILLRALSWCYMAYYEYTQQERGLHNADTLATITSYLNDVPWVLQSVT